MKTFLLFAVMIMSLALTAFCENQDYVLAKQSTLNNQTFKNITNKEIDSIFTSNSEISEFLKMITLHFQLFPNSYIIAKLGTDPLTCDYMFGRFDKELGKKISERINNGTISYVPPYVTKDKNKFDTWVKGDLKKGNHVITSFNKETEEYKGISLTEDEWEKLLVYKSHYSYK